MKTKDIGKSAKAKRLTILELMVIQSDQTFKRLAEYFDSNLIEVDKSNLRKIIFESMGLVGTVSEMVGLNLRKPVTGKLEISAQRINELISGPESLSDAEVDMIISTRGQTSVDD